MLRAKISSKINSEINVSGCLMGSVDDYVDVIKPQKDKLRRQFEKNRAHLVWQAEGNDPELNERISKVRRILQTMKNAIRGIYLRERKN